MATFAENTFFLITYQYKDSPFGGRKAKRIFAGNPPRLLRLFRTNQIVLHTLVLAYLAILWLPAFLDGEEASAEGAGYVTQWLLAILPDGARVHLVTALLLVWLQGLVVSSLALEYRMGPVATLFPGLALGLLHSATPEGLGLHAPLVGNLFVVLALQQLYTLYKSTHPAMQVFNVGLLLGLASLSFFPLAALLPAGWFALGIMRSNRLKETLQYLIGAAMPWFLLWLSWYWQQPAVSFCELAGVTLGWPPYLIGPSGPRMPVQALALLLVLFFLVSRFSQLGLGETTQVQKNISLAYIFLLAGAGSLLLTGSIQFPHFYVSVVPAGLLMGLWAARTKPARAETIHFLVFVLVAIYQYFPLL